jgi:hypothetical protein
MVGASAPCLLGKDFRGVHDKFLLGIGSLQAKHSNIVNGLAIPY